MYVRTAEAGVVRLALFTADRVVNVPLGGGQGCAGKNQYGDQSADGGACSGTDSDVGSIDIVYCYIPEREAGLEREGGRDLIFESKHQQVDSTPVLGSSHWSSLSVCVCWVG
ncbi:hypothetical protein RRG08_026247 [Elysia crispata]|uniref:Uncharacterized protein n=1 Tax=Elysia crispata TaxID=231223 RepID=A0AAE0ZBR7_9GAST|nr:hypothetical protein RRG08_026247 [Elysia crispata]